MFAILKNDDTFVASGDLEEVIYKVFNWFIDRDGQLTVRVKGFPEVKYHSYSKEYSKGEIDRDAKLFLARKVREFGMVLVKSVD